jgi:hypothetical protein
MKKENIANRTISLWSHIAKIKDNLLNPFYLPEERKTLEVSTAQKHMRFWKEHFLQFVDGFRDIYDIYSCKFTE